MDKTKEVLTTGQVARICKVAPRTVSKWFDTGQLRGYRIPGSKDRRIPLAQLVRFMKAHGIPLDELETGQMRVLIVDCDSDLSRLIQQAMTNSGEFEVRTAASAFEAGAVTDDFHPQVLLVDIDLPGMDGRTLSRYLSSQPELSDAQIVAMSASLTEGERQTLLQEGYANTIAKPFSIDKLTHVVEETLGVTV